MPIAVPVNKRRLVVMVRVPLFGTLYIAPAQFTFKLGAVRR
jgi:hypothetical protein